MRMCTTVFAVLTLGACSAPEDAVRISGSSTVFPFARTVAEHYAVKFDRAAPVIEMTGTGGGFQAFCAEGSVVDIANASRSIKQSERDLCARNGYEEVVQFRIGHDGIVIAAARENPLQSLTLAQLYRGLAKDLPTADGFTPNPYALWSQVDPSLPAIQIEVHGPPPTSGTRDAFVELALEAGAARDPALAALAETDPEAFAARAGALREDGRWIDEGENDNAIIQIIRQSSYALGVFGYSFYDQNRAIIDGVAVGGAAPNFNAIAGGDYPLARSLYFYTEPGRAGPEIAAYILEFTSESAVGPYGYVVEKGLIPLPEEERRRERRKAAALAALAEENSGAPPQTASRKTGEAP